MQCVCVYVRICWWIRSSLYKYDSFCLWIIDGSGIIYESSWEPRCLHWLLPLTQPPPIKRPADEIMASGWRRWWETKRREFTIIIHDACWCFSAVWVNDWGGWGFRMRCGRCWDIRGRSTGITISILWGSGSGSGRCFLSNLSIGNYSIWVHSNPGEHREFKGGTDIITKNHSIGMKTKDKAMRPKGPKGQHEYWDVWGV